ncbi:hypothetical protein EON80_30985, partial [bacterium]
MSFHLQVPKRFRCRAIGTLLALPLSGIALQSSPVQAQVAPARPAKKTLLSAEQKVAVEKFLAVAGQEKFCKKTIDFKIENASLEDIIASIKRIAPGENVAIEIRGARPLQLSFDLKQEKTGNLLNNVAALAGCKLFLRPEGLLIAPTLEPPETRPTEA